MRNVTTDLLLFAVKEAIVKSSKRKNEYDIP